MFSLLPGHDSKHVRMNLHLGGSVFNDLTINHQYSFAGHATAQDDRHVF